MAKGDQTSKIIILEDSDHDYDMLLRAFEKAQLEAEVSRYISGDDLLNDFFDNKKFENYPDFIFLDLNLPGTHGLEVLKRLKSDEKTKDITIAVLTSSEMERDIETCYDLGANTFVPKPMGLDDFVTTVQSIKSFWFDAQTGPDKG